MDTRRGNGNAGVGGRGGRDSRMPRSTASCWLNFKSRMARNHVWNSIQWISGAWSTEGAGVGMGGGISRLLRKACRKVGLYALRSGKQYQFLHATQQGLSVRAVEPLQSVRQSRSRCSLIVCMQLDTGTDDHMLP